YTALSLLPKPKARVSIVILHRRFACCRICPLTPLCALHTYRSMKRQRGSSLIASAHHRLFAKIMVSFFDIRHLNIQVPKPILSGS
ncbi:hypothetical protein ACCT09_10330, partial [Rhizobium ruizarguesonis]